MREEDCMDTTATRMGLWIKSLEQETSPEISIQVNTVIV